MKHLKLPVRVEGGAGRVVLRDAEGRNILDLEHHRELCGDLLNIVNQHDAQVFMLRRAERYFKALRFDIAKEISAMLLEEEDQSIIGQVLKEQWDDDGSDPELLQKDAPTGMGIFEGMDDEIELEIDVTPEELREEEEEDIYDDDPDSTFYD